MWSLIRWTCLFGLAGPVAGERHVLYCLAVPVSRSPAAMVVVVPNTERQSSVANIIMV